MNDEEINIEEVTQDDQMLNNVGASADRVAELLAAWRDDVDSEPPPKR